MPRYVKKGVPHGETHWGTTLKDSEVIFIFLNPEKAEYLAQIHSVSSTTIYNIWNRRTWFHLTANLVRPVKRREKGRT